MVNTIQSAIDEDRIIPVFQPVLNNETGKVEIYECLIRLKTKEDEYLKPDEFLEIAKKAGLYFKLTKIMVEKSFAVFENSDKFFSLNLDFLDMINEDTLKFIFEKIKSFPNPDRIIFEILETNNVESLQECLDAIAKLKECGARIAIDDFGSGNSNIKYLVVFNVDVIKIDGSIIRNIAKNEFDRKIVKLIKNMAEVSQAKVVAEFVSDGEIQKIVLEMGIEYSQGYYISKPVFNLEQN